MEGYRQRTIAELLKKTYKLNRPRMTPILEGKDRMQGPLDNTDAGMDFASLQVCGNCRNHLDATIAQNCGICNRGYHSFCLEAPLNSLEDRSLQCCYYCQRQVPLGTNQPGPSSEDAHNKLLEDGMDVCRSNENVQDCDEPGASYDAAEHSPVTKRMDLAWNDGSPSKRSADSEATIFDTLYKVTKTRAARKLGIRRKRILDSSGNDDSNSQVLSSDTDTLRPAVESSGADVLKEVGRAMSTCPEAGVEDIKEHGSAAACIADLPTANVKMKSDPGEDNGDQLLETNVVFPNKDAKIAIEEIPAGDDLIKEGIVTGAIKMIGSPIAIVARPVNRNADMLSEDRLMGSCINVSAISGAPLREIREEMQVVRPLISRDSAKERHPPLETANVVAQMVVEHDAVSERQSAMQKQPDFAEQPKEDDDAHRVSARLISNTSCDTDVPAQNTTGEGTLSPAACTTPAIAKNKSSCLALEGQDEDDKVKPLIFVDVRGTLPRIQGEPDEHCYSDGLANKAGSKEELPPKEYLSPKAHMDIDSIFTGSETNHAASLDSPNDGDAMEDDSKVCDICGDAGYEGMLAICSECNGAEHVYCYQNLMAQVPEGYWQCDRCRSKQKAGDFRPSTDVRSVSSLPTRLPSFNSTKKHGIVGNARSRLSALLQKRRLPSEKKRAMKGVPSSQFPAKRGIVENAVDAPPAKKQAMEVSSLPYMPSSKFGLSREAPFKIPDTGKIKFVSHTALMGTSAEGTGPFSRGNSKSPLSSGSPGSTPLNFSPAQSGQTSKARFLSASNTGVGTGSVKVNTANQLNVASSSAPLVTSGLKTSGALKSSESLPSFLLTLKSTSSKPQSSSKGLREATDNICQQSLSKEGFSSQAGIANTRVLSKTSSFKLSKAISSGGAVEPKSKNDANFELAKPPGSKIVHPEVGLMKSAENKLEVGSISSLAENRSKAAPTDTHVPLEMHNGVHNSYKLIRHDVGGNLQVTNLPLKNETVLVASGTSEAHPVLSSSIKDAQDLSIEQDKNLGFKVASPISLARQTSKLSEQVGPDISKEVTKTSADEVQWAGLLPCPVIVVQEAPTFKAEENKGLQLAVNVDAVGEKSPSALIDKAPTHDDNRSSFTPRSRSFGAWGSPSYVPSLGSTRCYRCKELGHSAKNCNNRNSMPCISSEAAGAFKAVLPATNVDSSTSVLKGVVPTYSMDNSMRIVQNVVEVAPKIKLTTEMAPIIKPLGTERVLASVQILNPVVGEAQAQMNEGQILENIVPLALPVPNPLVDQQTRKDTMAHKQIITDSGLTLSQVIVSGVDNTDDTTEIAGGKKQEDMTLVCPMNPTNASISSGTQLMTSSAECLPPVFSVPSIPKNAAHLSAALGSPSSADVKATTPFVSRYQESLKVYPEAQIVWQGTFEVAGKAKPQVSFHGLQANPSNRAVAKVRKVAKKLHPLVPLEELPRGSEHDSWPVQFQKSPPINDNIALYFFASSKESYVQYYKPLVDRLIKFDFTLKGSIEDAELLIFPSNLLPPGSQCWNNFMFLWAVFRPRKIPIKLPNIPYESKQSGSDGAFRLPLQSGVLTWGRGEDMQIDTIGNKNIEILHSKPETPISNIAEGAIIVGPSVLSDPDVVCEQQQPCQQDLQHLTQEDTLVKERFEQNAQTDPILSQPEKAVAMLLSSTQDSMAVVKSQPLSRSLPPVEGGLGLDASNESSQIPNSSRKLEEKVDTSNKLVAPSTAKVSSALLRSEHGNSEKAKHSTPLMGTSPAVMVCPSPRDRQEDPWTARKLSSHSPAGHQDKDKGVRERINDKSDRMETGKGVNRDRDREKPRDRDKHKERDRDRDRSRRHSDWEREKERDRGKERERDRDRDRDRDRGRERERDRERWRDREERDRRGRDWDRDRDKVGERDKGRERGREREAERERVVLRDRSSRHRHWEPSEADYGRSGRHWHRYPRSRTPSRSPPVNRDWSPSRPRLDRYHHRHRRSSRHSRSYSPSPDSDHGVGRIQPRAESRELSKDSFAHKGKSPDIIVGDSRAKEESAVNTSAVKDLGGDEAGNFSQRGSNSNSLCREKTAEMERKVPIADLNLSPSEIEGNEEGNEDDVTMSVEVAMPLNASPDDHTSGCQDFFPPIGGSGSNEEPGECSISAGKIANSRSTEHLICVDGRNDSLSHSLMNDSSGPSLFPLNMSLEGSSSCLQFFPQATNDDDRVPSAPDLNLALGAKEQSLPQKGELPLFMQLLKPCQESSRLGTLNPLLDVPMASEQADLSLSLAIPEHSKRPVVNTSLRLFG